MLLLELGVSEDILKECVGLDAQGEVLYQMAKSQRQRGTLQMVGKVTRRRGSSCVDGTIA